MIGRPPRGVQHGGTQGRGVHGPPSAGTAYPSHTCSDRAGSTTRIQLLSGVANAWGARRTTARGGRRRCLARPLLSEADDGRATLQAERCDLRGAPGDSRFGAREAQRGPPLGVRANGSTSATGGDITNPRRGPGDGSGGLCALPDVRRLRWAGTDAPPGTAGWRYRELNEGFSSFLSWGSAEAAFEVGAVSDRDPRVPAPSR